LLSVGFDGDWKRYKRLRPAFETQAREASKARVRNVPTATYADGLEPKSTGYQPVRDILVQLDEGRIEVRAEEYEQAESFPIRR